MGNGISSQSRFGNSVVSALVLFTAAFAGRAVAQTPAAKAVMPAATQSAPANTGGQPTVSVQEVYRLQPGDEIQVRAYNLPELEQTVRVRPDGKISLLLLNDVDAGGRSAEELGKALSAAYGHYFREPKVTAIVRTFTNRNVYVGGEVNQPRLIALTGKLSTAAAIFYAGGFKNTAKTKEVIILHKNENNSTSIQRLNLAAVLSKGAEDIDLRPYDVVYVPKSRIARLDQFVDQYMKQLMPIATNLGFSYILGGQGFVVSIP